MRGKAQLISHGLDAMLVASIVEDWIEPLRMDALPQFSVEPPLLGSVVFDQSDDDWRCRATLRGASRGKFVASISV